MKYFFYVFLFLGNCQSTEYDYILEIRLLLGLADNTTISSKSENIETLDSHNEILSYKFEKKFNNIYLQQDILATIDNHEIHAFVPKDIDITSLIATFTTNAQNILVGKVEQISGVSKNDFSSGIVYKTIAEDLTEKQYQVSISYQLPSEKDFTYFSFLQSNNSSLTRDYIAKIVDEKITFENFLDSIDRRSLIATFSSTGEKILVGDMEQKTDQTVNDFISNPIYTVQAEDGTRRSYEVKFQLISNSVPTVSSLAIVGSTVVGETLTAVYHFSDPDGDAEGTSSFRWLRADSADGPFSHITGAENRTYVLKISDIGKFFKFEVTPRDIYNAAGSKVISDASAAITCQNVCDGNNGTVSVLNRNLTWMKCSVGQKWRSSENDCKGNGSDPDYGLGFYQYCSTNDNACNSTSTWELDSGGSSQIRNLCDTESIGGYNDWRVPTKSELADFYNHAYSISFFPQTRPAYYRSSTSCHDVFLICFNDDTAWTHNFGTGVVWNMEKNKHGALRCVRNGL